MTFVNVRSNGQPVTRAGFKVNAFVKNLTIRP